MSTKQRLSVSVDGELVEAAERAVDRGHAATVSAWVGDAMRLKLEHEARLDALATFVAGYEAEHGEITADEMQAATRRARARALTARSDPPGRPVRRRGGARR